MRICLLGVCIFVCLSFVHTQSSGKSILQTLTGHIILLMGVLDFFLKFVGQRCLLVLELTLFHTLIRYLLTGSLLVYYDEFLCLLLFAASTVFLFFFSRP